MKISKPVKIFKLFFENTSRIQIKLNIEKTQPHCLPSKNKVQFNTLFI
jgi:hypothetical protein